MSYFVAKGLNKTNSICGATAILTTKYIVKAYVKVAIVSLHCGYFWSYWNFTYPIVYKMRFLKGKALLEKILKT